MKANISVFRFDSGCQGTYKRLGTLENHFIFSGTWSSTPSPLVSGPITNEKAYFCKVGTNTFKLLPCAGSLMYFQLMLPGRDVFQNEIEIIGLTSS